MGHLKCNENLPELHCINMLNTCSVNFDSIFIFLHHNHAYSLWLLNLPDVN